MAFPYDLNKLLGDHDAKHINGRGLINGGTLDWYMINGNMLLVHVFESTTPGVALYVSPTESWEETLAKLSEPQPTRAD